MFGPWGLELLGCRDRGAEGLGAKGPYLEALLT